MLNLLSGCASNSVTTLLKASKQTDAITPTTSAREELTGRAFEVGSVAFDLRTPADKQGPDIPDSAYLELLDAQLHKAFTGARLGNGAAPVYPVNVMIERLKLKPATFLIISEWSTFRVRMEVARASGEILLRGQFESFFPPPVTMIMASGIVVPIALPAEDWEYVALAKMFPAVAVVIAQTARGLQEGKTLDEIRIYPQDIDAGSMISPDLFLKNSPFGLTQMDAKEIGRVIREARAREGR